MSPCSTWLVSGCRSHGGQLETSGGTARPSVGRGENAFRILSQEAPEACMALDELQKGTGHHLFCAAAETVRHLICHGGTLLQGHSGTALRQAIASAGSVEDQTVGLQQGIEVRQRVHTRNTQGVQQNGHVVDTMAMRQGPRCVLQGVSMLGSAAMFLSVCIS